MATVSGTLKTYDQVGKKEDIEDIIYQISPTDTPFISNIGTTKAHNTLHQWQTHELAATGTNAAVDGADAGNGTQLTTTMLNNHTQIFTKVANTSGTANAVQTYGRAKEHAFQILNHGIELKRDVEHAMVGAGQAGTAGNNTTPRQLKSAQNFIDSATTNTAGSNRTLTEALVKDALKKCYNEGGQPNILMVSANHADVIAGFAENTSGSRNRDFGTGTTVTAAVDIYQSPWGKVNVVLNRHINENTVLALDKNYWSRAVLRPVQTIKLAKTGDSEKTLLLTEQTLVCRSPKASGLVSALTA